MDERRYKRIGIAAGLLVTMCTRGAVSLARCVEGVPEGARFVCLDVDPDNTAPGGLIWLVVEHPEWPDVPHGVDIPVLLPEFTQLQSADELPDWFPGKAGA